MINLEPNIAAAFAAGIYGVQDEYELSRFMLRPEFSKKSAEKRTLQAEVGFRLINAKDGFGVCAVGAGQYEGDIFLIFRGSTFAHLGADWASNTRCGVEHGFTGTLVHIGFNQIFASMRNEINLYIKQNLGVRGSVHCVGHSLGGAIATLAADYVSHFYPNKKTYLYTFGAPKNGFENFIRKLTTRIGASSIHRVYHQNDPVPMVPIYPFVHAPIPGDGYRLPFGKAYISGAAHRIGAYVGTISQQNWLALKGCPDPELNDIAIEEWLKQDSDADLASPTTWNRLNSALTWVLKKVAKGLMAAIQIPISGIVTLADKIAWLLKEGIDLSAQAAGWVLSLMKKIMRALGMKVAETAVELTRNFMASILAKLVHRMNQEAKKAIKELLGER
jgi:triacylglycerol lipase